MSPKPGLNREQTVNLLEELAAIERMAKKTREQLAAGFAKNGTSGLYRIEQRANDARRWADSLIVGREVRT